MLSVKIDVFDRLEIKKKSIDQYEKELNDISKLINLNKVSLQNNINNVEKILKGIGVSDDKCS